MRHHSRIYKKEREIRLNEGWHNIFREQPKRVKKSIKGIGMIPSNAHQCRVCYDGKSVYANSKFHAGDIIEVCPCRPIERNSLYTRDVRDMVFEVEPNEKFVIPLGYCQYYNIIDGVHPEPNCDYEWNADDSTIVIRALCTIPKSTVLIINIEGK